MKSLKTIIREELQPIINEASVVRDDKLRFTQWIDSEFWNYQGFSNDYDTTIDPAKVAIQWNINFWVNQQGISSFNIEVESADGIILLRYQDKQSDEQLQEVQKSLSEFKWNFKVEEGVVMQMGSGLYIKKANFDFANNLCTVTF